METCFVVCPIGNPDSAIRKRSNGYLREVIRPVLEESGYDVERADHDKSPGVVTESIVRKLVDADVVVADLHDHNPNVMYEVAIRHATGKPIIQMIGAGEALPFDIGGLNTILYDASVDGLEKWRNDLRSALGAVESGEVGSNPVARAGLFRALFEQGGSEGEALAALAQSIEDLRWDFRATQSRRVRHHSSRVLLPPDKLMENLISSFLISNTTLGDRRFMVDAKEKVVRVSLLPRDMNGPTGGQLSYEFSWDEPGVYDEADRIKRELLRDIEELEAGQMSLLKESGVTSESHGATDEA